MKAPKTFAAKWWLIPMMTAALALGACSSSDDDTNSGNTEEITDGADGTDGTDGVDGTGVADPSKVIVTGVATNYSSAAVEIYNTSAPYDGQTSVDSSSSDISVRLYEDLYFLIRRSGSDSVAAYSLDDPSTVIFQSSTNDSADESSNPHDLVFIDSEKAYLVRYGSTKVWEVNPSATDAGQFKTGEIDISGYSTTGVANATRGIVVGDKLFVVMQRLENWVPTQSGAVAVFDINNGVEVDTGTNDAFKGIELPGRNPKEISFDEATNTIFIAAVGDYGSGDVRPRDFIGGIITVDTEDYSTNLLIDDTEETGLFSGVEVFDANTAFLIALDAGFSSARVVKFDPNTGTITDNAFGSITGVDVRDIAKGPEGNLWIAIGDPANPRVVVLNPADGSQIGEALQTMLNPAGLNFAK